MSHKESRVLYMLELNPKVISDFFFVITVIRKADKSLTFLLTTGTGSSVLCVSIRGKSNKSLPTVNKWAYPLVRSINSATLTLQFGRGSGVYEA